VPGWPVAAALCGVYFVAAKLGLRLAFVHPSATAVWPPAGIALAAFLILGYRVWPAILLGAFLVNLTTAGSVATSVGIAAGNTLEGLVGAYLVNRFAGGRHAFDRAQDIFRFAVLAALVSTTVSATFGVTSLSLGGFASWRDYGPIWMTWWLGDASGDLVVAPVLLLWSTTRRQKWRNGQVLEAVVLLLLLILVGGVVFGGLFASRARNYPLEFLSIPLLVWTAFRFGRRDAAAGSILLSAVAIWGTLRGFGPFARESPNESLLLLQAFLGVTALTTTALAAVVSERRRVEQSLRLLESAVDHAVEGVVTLAALSNRSEPQITFVNGGFSRMTGLASSEVVGKTLEVLRISRRDRNVMEELCRALSKGKRFEGEARALRRDGSAYALELQITPVPDEAGSSTRWVGILRDVSGRRAQLETLEYQALHDSLTGLPNRFLLRDRLDQAIRASERKRAAVAVFLLDLDRFKEINDTFGHQVGDVLLKQIGPRLHSVLRSVDTISRLGGDEFALLLPTGGNRTEATLMAERILQALETPFVIEGHSFDISGSIGIALSPEHGTDWATLMRKADVAMYAAKRSRNGFVFYSSEDVSIRGSRTSSAGGPEERR